MHHGALLALVALGIGLQGAPATAQTIIVPNPFLSSIDSCFVSCPNGDVAFTIVIRDVAGRPIAGSSVTIDFGTCPSVRLCDTQEESTSVDRRILGRVADSTGTVIYHVRAGGLCPGAKFIIYADGVNLGSRDVASFDQNGDLVVDSTDEGISASKLGTSDVSADFACDKTVSKSDLALLEDHLQHRCANSTPTRRASWGSLRVLYR